jgi:hypothetical protein
VYSRAEITCVFYFIKLIAGLATTVTSNKRINEKVSITTNPIKKTSNRTITTRDIKQKLARNVEVER